MEPSAVMDDASSAWLKLHGSEGWVGLLDPLDPSLRDEILKYGRFAQATYEAYEKDGLSCGSCRYDAGSLLNEVGLGNSGYDVTGYLYATMVLLRRVHRLLTLLPKKDCVKKFLRTTLLPKKDCVKKFLRIDSWSEDCNWMGYVAVSGEEESRRLGRREILVAWRGTKEPSEWFKVAQRWLETLKTDTADGSVAAMVEHGFQSIYTSNSRRGRFTESSASDQVMEKIRGLVDTYCKEDMGEVSLTVTGHSLGGALALLTAYDAAAECIPGLSHVSVVSFGAPKVGNAAFGDELVRKGVKVLRVVIKEDVVPKVPGLVSSRYQHVGVEMGLDMDDQARGWPLKVVAAHKLKTYLHLLELEAAATPMPAPAAMDAWYQSRSDPWASMDASATNSAARGSPGTAAVYDSSSASYLENPYFLRSSDNPGITLVSSPLLGDNYVPWQRAMSVALSAKNKLAFVNGTIPEPAIDDPSRSDWERVNSMVLSWIFNSIHRDLVPSVLNATTASGVWLDLKERFSPSNGRRFYSLERSIANLHQGNDSIAKYYNTLMGYWDELAQFDGTGTTASYSLQRSHLMQFLMGLNGVYSAVRSQILLIDPLPSVARAYSLLLQDESQRLIQAPSHIEVSAMMTNFSGHQTSRRPQPVGSLQNTSTTVPALTAEQYAQLLKLPSNSNVSNNPQAHMAGNIPHSGSNWILDSGASAHIASPSVHLNSVPNDVSPTAVALPTGNTVPIEESGSFQLTSSIRVPLVYRTSSFTYNLLSVSQLAKNSNCRVIFYPTYCVLQDLSTGMEIRWGREQMDYIILLRPLCQLFVLHHHTSPSTSGINDLDTLQLKSKDNLPNVYHAQMALLNSIALFAHCLNKLILLELGHSPWAIVPY